MYWADWSSQCKIKISCTDATSLRTNQGSTPFICKLLSPHSSQFQHPAGATPSLYSSLTLQYLLTRGLFHKILSLLILCINEYVEDPGNFLIILGCYYITVDSGTNALQNGACTYRCISKQMHYKTPFSHNGYMKSLEIYENYITLFCLEENKLFDKITLTQNQGWHITQSG